MLVEKQLTCRLPVGEGAVTCQVQEQWAKVGPFPLLLTSLDILTANIICCVWLG
jgi:hypothetical protein